MTQLCCRNPGHPRRDGAPAEPFGPAGPAGSCAVRPLGAPRRPAVVTQDHLPSARRTGDPDPTPRRGDVGRRADRRRPDPRPARRRRRERRARLRPVGRQGRAVAHRHDRRRRRLVPRRLHRQGRRRRAHRHRRDRGARPGHRQRLARTRPVLRQPGPRADPQGRLRARHAPGLDHRRPRRGRHARRRTGSTDRLQRRRPRRDARRASRSARSDGAVDVSQVIAGDQLGGRAPQRRPGPESG